jgi:hypothetical protein
MAPSRRSLKGPGCLQSRVHRTPLARSATAACNQLQTCPAQLRLSGACWLFRLPTVMQARTALKDAKQLPMPATRITDAPRCSSLLTLAHRCGWQPILTLSLLLVHVLLGVKRNAGSQEAANTLVFSGSAGE